MHEAAARDMERLYDELERLLGQSDVLLWELLGRRHRRRAACRRGELPRFGSRPDPPSAAHLLAWPRSRTPCRRARQCRRARDACAAPGREALGVRSVPRAVAQRPPRVGHQERLCRLVHGGDERGPCVLPALGSAPELLSSAFLRARPREAHRLLSERGRSRTRSPRAAAPPPARSRSGRRSRGNPRSPGSSFGRNPTTKRPPGRRTRRTSLRCSIGCRQK